MDLTRREVYTIFGALLAAMLLSALDQSVVSTALPTIVGDLGAAQGEGWIVTAYLLAIAIVMPIYGKVGDLVGRRLPFLLAIALFVIGSTGSALSGSFEGLVTWRSLQGLGAGGLVILSQAIIADIVSPRERGKFMGPMGAVFGIATGLAIAVLCVFVPYALRTDLSASAESMNVESATGESTAEEPTVVKSATGGSAVVESTSVEAAVDRRPTV